MELAVVNGRTRAYQDLEAIYLDRAFFFGDGVYEVLRSYQGRIFALAEHFQRFRNSLEAVGLGHVDLQVIQQQVEETYAQSGIANAKIYFHITRGTGDRDPALQGLEPQFFLTVTDLPDATQDKERGVKASIFPDWRWKRCDIKSLNLLPNVLARRDALAQGCQEAILVNDDGMITEGSGSGFFAVFNRDTQSQSEYYLQTTPLSANILPSVTRSYVIKAAQRLGIEVIEDSYTVPQAKKAAELFLAVTTKDIVPVVQFDNCTIETGMPGRLTRALMDVFQKFYQQVQGATPAPA